MQDTGKTAPRPLGKKTLLLNAVIVIGLSILNCSALNIAYSVFSSDIVYSSSALPQILFYLMAVITTSVLFIGAAPVIYSGTLGDTKGLLKSAGILFAALTAGIITTLLVFAFEYSGEYFWTIIGKNLTKLLVQTLLNLCRVGAIALISLYLYRRRDYAFQLHIKTLLSVLFISGITVFIELTEATIPFFIKYGNDIDARSLFTIALAYIIIAAHAILGYFICKLCYALYEKRKP